MDKPIMKIPLNKPFNIILSKSGVWKKIYFANGDVYNIKGLYTRTPVIYVTFPLQPGQDTPGHVTFFVQDTYSIHVARLLTNALKLAFEFNEEKQRVVLRAYYPTKEYVIPNQFDMGNLPNQGTDFLIEMVKVE